MKRYRVRVFGDWMPRTFEKIEIFDIFVHSILICIPLAFYIKIANPVFVGGWNGKPNRVK